MALEGVPYKFNLLGWRYVFGTTGAAGWTTHRDDQGYFWSFYLKPSGVGARKGHPSNYTYVERKNAKHRIKKDAIRRAENMADGKPINEGKPKRIQNASPPGTIYCKKDQQYVIPSNVITVSDDKEHRDRGRLSALSRHYPKVRR